jgi:hypothetical protein
MKLGNIIFSFNQISSIKITSNLLEFHSFGYPQYEVKKEKKWEKSNNLNLSSPKFQFYCVNNLDDIKNILIYVDEGFKTLF